MANHKICQVPVLNRAASLDSLSKHKRQIPAETRWESTRKKAGRCERQTAGVSPLPFVTSQAAHFSRCPEQTIPQKAGRAKTKGAGLFLVSVEVCKQNGNTAVVTVSQRWKWWDFAKCADL